MFLSAFCLVYMFTSCCFGTREQELTVTCHMSIKCTSTCLSTIHCLRRWEYIVYGIVVFNAGSLLASVFK